MPEQSEPDRLVRWPEVSARCNIKSRNTMLAMERKGAFPKRLLVQGQVMWRESEIVDWMANLEPADGKLIRRNCLRREVA